MNEAGIEQNIAIEVMTPKARSGPPSIAVFLKTTTYNGMKTVSNPNAMSWKKNPNRHIAKGLLESNIKAFASTRANKFPTSGSQSSSQ